LEGFGVRRILNNIMASSRDHVGKSLELKSPMGEATMVYKWPLKKGKGSVKRSEVKTLFLKVNSCIF
jgi:hypothetical protein